MSELNQERAIGRLEGQLAEISIALRSQAQADATFRQQVMAVLEEVRTEVRSASSQIRDLQDWRLSITPIIQSHADYIDNARRAAMVTGAGAGGFASLVAAVLYAVYLKIMGGH